MHRLVVLTLLLPVSLLAGLADHPDVTAAERVFRAWMEEQLAYRGLPRIAVGVVHDQELVWSQGFGFANLDAKVSVTPATKFRMASHSKLFTATAVMQLRDQGKLRLDDLAVKYLPWFQPRTAEPDADAITIEELLTHSSGLTREAGSHWSDYEFPDAGSIQKYVRENTAAYAPGVRWKYSNLAFTVAGMLVEAVSGESYADYVRKHIFEPLGGCRHHVHGGGHGALRAAVQKGTAGRRVDPLDERTAGKAPRPGDGERLAPRLFDPVHGEADRV